MKRNIKLMLINCGEKEVLLIKKWCSENEIEFIFKYQRTKNQTLFNEFNIHNHYFFEIIGDTDNYHKMMKDLSDISKNIELTNYSKICNIADLDNSFELELEKQLLNIKKLCDLKEKTDHDFCSFIMSIKKASVLKILLDQYSGNMNNHQKEILKSRIYILSNEREKIDEELESNINSIYTNVKELREKTNMNRREFCNYFNIPYRTVEDWETKKSCCSIYLYKLMEEKLKTNNLFK